MKKNDQWYIDRYVRAVSSWLPCSRQTKKLMLDKLRGRIKEFVADGGSPAKLEEHFGLPRQVAEAYLDDMPTTELLSEMHIRRRIVRVVAISLAAALAIFTTALCIEVYDNHQAMHGWGETYVIPGETWTVED